VSNRRQWLRVNGVFYYCRPWLNGHDLGLHQGYFVPHEFDVTSLLQADNQLVLEVSCPEEHNKVDKQLITGVFSHWDSMDSTRNPGVFGCLSNSSNRFSAVAQCTIDYTDYCAQSCRCALSHPMRCVASL
jgi:hypothetical protein